jgi:hypothetical protein
MQRLRIACLVGVVGALALPARAEDQIVNRTMVWKIKPGMEAKFEEGLKRHNDFHRKHADTMALITFQIQSGPDTGAYVRFAGGRHWQDFDAEEAMAKEDQADTAVNTDPYIASTTTRYYRSLTDVSRPQSAAAAMYAIAFYRVKPGKTDDFMRAIGKINEAIGKTQWPVHYSWFALANGGDGPEFVLSMPRDKWADFNPPEKTFDKMLEEAFGRSEAESIMDTYDHAISSVSSQIVVYRADLSYLPAKK